MTSWRLRLTLICGLTLVFTAAIARPHRAVHADGPCDRYVLGIDASDTGDCSDEAYPCRSIQYAIDQAVHGDVICVAKHVLAGPLVYEETLAITRSITLNGAWDAMCVDPSDLTCSFTAIPCNPENVTIDAQGAGRPISITGSIAPVIDCFTLTGGDATGLGGSGPTGYDMGGGLYSGYANTTVANSVIRNNVASTSGIAWGGGLGFFQGNSIVHNCLIRDNVASEASNGYGGGIYFRHGSGTLEDSIVQNNTASTVSDGRGGGVAYHFGTLTMEGTTVRGNVANSDVIRSGYGGGVFLYGGGGSRLTNNVVEGNLLFGSGTGSGIYVYSTELQMLHTTLANNSGGAGLGAHALAGATVEMTNTIVSSQTVGVQASDPGTSVRTEATLWWDTPVWGQTVGGATLQNVTPNVIAAPGFVNPGCGDFHINAGSAAIDAGIPCGVANDMDGDPRTMGAAPDLGADEYVRARVYMPLVLR